MGASFGRHLMDKLRANRQFAEDLTASQLEFWSIHYQEFIYLLYQKDHTARPMRDITQGSLPRNSQPQTLGT